MKWVISDVNFSQKSFESFINEIFINVLERFVFVVVSDFLGIVRLLIMQKKQRDSRAVEPATSTNSVTVVGDCGWDVEQNNVTQIREIETSRSDLCTYHDCVLR